MRGSAAVGTFNPRMLGADEVTISLPDGRVLRATRQQVTEDNAKGVKSWVGTFTEQPGSIVSFSTVRGVTSGFISYGTETYEVVPARAAGKHILFRVDDSKLPSVELEDSQKQPQADRDVSSMASDYGIGATTATTGGSVIDLLVVYTPAARVAHGQATLVSMIQNGVAMANQAYLNSKVAITLNLVGTQEIAYVESGVQASLDALRGTTDGKMDSVHALRNSVGADVVTLISDDADACGIAGVMTSVSTSFASNAFNVVKASCLSQHSLAHEIGHNMGNKHDRESTTGSGAYPYSYGFRRCVSDGTGFRTVMAYSCTGASRVAWFSNPNAYYNGYATGIAYETSPTSSADNARSMNNTAATVAAFRSTSGSIAPSVTLPAAPTALAATAASASAVNLRWTDNATNETGYVVQRSQNGVDFTQIATLGAGTVSYSSSGLAASTNYYYRVRAYNSAGNSNFSNTASVSTSSATALIPAKPTNVAGSGRTNGSARVTWADASANETYFEIYRQTWSASTQSWVSAKIVAKVAANSGSYIDYSGAGTFNYSVRAGNSAGASSYAGPVSIKVSKK